MTPETVLYLGREALYTILLVSAPILGGSLLVGLLISVFQATTQIQEQTLTFVPKIVVVLLVVAFFGPWMLKVLSAFTTNLFINIPQLIK
ncbi:MAG: flagellar biosynthesis protein FliQ [Eubacteriales bacterium]|nr:flagellar biosynthesis protein FliQ [Eubacteriales bacterium]MDN5363894.1 flagellar biosynthesis protein FliQ [Eubacteriales bacterium]